MLVFALALAMTVWVAAVAVLAAQAVRALRDPDAGAASRFVTGLGALRPPLVAPPPAALLVLAPWTVGGAEPWALVPVGAAFVAGAVHQSGAALAATRAAERGDHPETDRQLSRWAWGTAALVGLLALATAVAAG